MLSPRGKLREFPIQEQSLYGNVDYVSNTTMYHHFAPHCIVPVPMKENILMETKRASNLDLEPFSYCSNWFSTHNTL